MRVEAGGLALALLMVVLLLGPFAPLLLSVLSLLLRLSRLMLAVVVTTAEPTTHAHVRHALHHHLEICSVVPLLLGEALLPPVVVRLALLALDLELLFVH